MWPATNAALNAAAAVLLVLGWREIRAGRVARHRLCMGAAVAVSAIFLASYLLYHSRVGSVPFTGTGWIRPVYFAILLSHTVLAAAIVPLVGRTVWLALRNRIDAHRALARWTFPIWLYVSVTGVIVYLLLYQRA